MYKLHKLLTLMVILGFCFASLSIAQQTPVNAGTESDVILHQPEERDSFTVALIADRAGGWPEGLKELRRAVYEINQLDPDFVIHVGDMVVVEGYTRNVELWIQECEEFRSVIDELEAPWYPIVGNHDVIRGSRDPDDKTFENLYRKHFGPLYYSFDYKNSHFVCLDTDEALQSKAYFSDAQIQWLKTDLENTDKTNIFVYMHKPVWGEYYKESRWSEIHEMLTKYPVRAVIVGHYHSYRKCPQKDGIQYYILGATGGHLYEEVELAGQFNHYNILTVKGDSFTMGVVKLGNVESDDYVVEKDADRIRKFVTQRGETRVEGWLWQPIFDEVTGTVKIRIANPLDTEIKAELNFNGESHWTTELPLGRFVLDPNGAVSVEVKLHSKMIDPEDVMLPKFVVEYFYPNKKQKLAKVPVKLWVPLRTSYELDQRSVMIDVDGRFDEPDWEKATAFYTKAWVPSHYEREDDPCPTIHVTADDGYFYFCAIVPDEVYEYYREENRSDRLLSDQIVFAADNDDETKAVLIFPFDESHQAFKCSFPDLQLAELEPINGVQYATTKNPDKNLYICEGKIRYDKLFGTKEVVGKEFLFNVAVVDNDQNAFSYMKSWASAGDKEHWGIVRFVAN